jgi:uncharacterized membrane protein
MHPKILAMLQRQSPGLINQNVCYYCAQDFRNQLLQELLKNEKGTFDNLEKKVLSTLRSGESISENINEVAQQKLTRGEKLADIIASFGGSWTFIIIFGVILSLWIFFNSTFKSETFDPYPFILLNLILSCLAAIQAPIIMMSQNRQEAKDRLRSEHDYQVNLKAELEIRELHLKLDQLMTQHWQNLLEIQEAQIEILNEQTHLMLDHKPTKKY